MSPLEILRTAIANTFRSRLRTALTILAIFVGAFTLTLTNGVGTGINSYIAVQVSSMGASDMILVSKARRDSGAFGAADSGPAVYDPERVMVMSAESMQIEMLTEGDLATILAIDGIERVEPMLSVTPDYISRNEGTKYEFGVTSNVLHPGLVRTGFASNVYLATSPAVENVTGKYWEKSKAVPSGRATYDEATWMRLWEVSDKMVASRATPAKAETA